MATRSITIAGHLDSSQHEPSGATTDPSGVERRTTRRFLLRVPVEYENGGPGSGTLWDISESGARIGEVSRLVAPGTMLTLRFSFFAGSFDVPLRGETVRRTDCGFAVRFIDVSEHQLDMLLRAFPGATARSAPSATLLS